VGGRARAKKRKRERTRKGARREEEGGRK